MANPKWKVRWEVEVEAPTPEAAAEQALAFQREAISGTFKVNMIGPCPSCGKILVHERKCPLNKRYSSMIVDKLHTVEVTGKWQTV